MGIASVTAELAGKSVQLIRDMLPSARRVTVLANAADPFSRPFLEQVRRGGEVTGTTISAMRISGSEEFENAFAAMEKERSRCRHRSTQPAEQTRRRAGAEAAPAGGVGATVVRSRGRADVV